MFCSNSNSNCITICRIDTDHFCFSSACGFILSHFNCNSTGKQLIYIRQDRWHTEIQISGQFHFRRCLMIYNIIDNLKFCTVFLFRSSHLKVSFYKIFYKRILPFPEGFVKSLLYKKHYTLLIPLQDNICHTHLLP